MKVNVVKMILMAVVVMVMTACTRNNGDIGELFGTWRVVSIEKGGQELTSDAGSLYFSFQSSIYCQRYIYDDTYGAESRFASWKYEGDGIVVDFSDERYAPIAITGMQQGQNYVEIERSDGSDMVMSYTTPDGDKYVYTLKKW